MKTQKNNEKKVRTNKKDCVPAAAEMKKYWMKCSSRGNGQNKKHTMKTLKLFLCLFIFLLAGREIKALGNNPEEKNAHEVLVVTIDVFGRENYSMLTRCIPGEKTFYLDKNNKLSPGTYIVVSSSDAAILWKKIIVIK